MRCCLSLLLILILAVTAPAQDSPSPVRDQVERIVTAHHVTGMSAAYFEGGQIVHTVATGLDSAGGTQPVSSQTVFSAASLSKPVLAYLVWQLADEGILDLDDPVSEHFDYADLRHDDRATIVTVRQLLTHHGGLPNWREGDTLRFNQDPGLGFSYSGEGYVWLQRMLEHVTGLDYAALARQRVFEPLGMTRSSMVFEDRFQDDYAVPHNDHRHSEAMHRWSKPNAAASLQTTAPDYARFLIALIKRTDMLEQHLPVNAAMWNDSPAPEANTVGWVPGLGFQRGDRGTQYWHWGHNNGFRAYFTIVPAEERGLVFFSNDSNGLDLVPDLTDYAELGPQAGWRWAGYAPE